MEITSKRKMSLNALHYRYNSQKYLCMYYVRFFFSILNDSIDKDMLH